MQAGCNSNAVAFFAGLRAKLAEASDLTQGGVGEEVADAMAIGVIQQTVSRQSSPDGSRLAENRGEYGERKRAAGLPILVGLDNGGEMTSFSQVRGRPEITANVVAIEPGSDERNRMLAHVHHFGRKDNSIEARPWFGWNDDIVRIVEDILLRRLSEVFH